MIMVYCYDNQIKHAWTLQEILPANQWACGVHVRRYKNDYDRKFCFIALANSWMMKLTDIVLK